MTNMGKIKSKSIRRTTDTLLKKDLPFNENFEDNKKILGRSLPSKKIRNQISGLISKLKKQERINEEKIKKETTKVK